MLTEKNEKQIFDEMDKDNRNCPKASGTRCSCSRISSLWIQDLYSVLSRDCDSKDIVYALRLCIRGYEERILCKYVKRMAETVKGDLEITTSKA